ncbi:MAG: DUF192 domain-containing protein [Dehalococcoidia bacterium]
MKMLRATIGASGMVLAERVRVADNIWSRFWGLMGRRNMPANEGLLIAPCYSVHTMFMRFRIDVIFLDKDDRVLKIAPALKPFRAAVDRGARSVLQMNAGAADEVQLSVGAQVLFTETSQAPGQDPRRGDDSRSP